MSLLIGLHQVHLSQSGRELFSSLDWQIHQTKRFALIGRNGAGKSSLLQLLAQKILPDAGHIHFQKGLRVASLVQDLSSSLGATVYEDILNRVLEQTCFEQNLSVHDFFVEANALCVSARWHDSRPLLEFVQNFNAMMQVFQLPLLAQWQNLSGGMKRRCALAASLLIPSDVLLLDEPTNHLDIAAILFLENFLKQYKGAVVFVTHDRCFLKAVATHIVALEHARLKEYEQGFDAYLNQREAELAEIENENNRLQHKLKQEEHWLQRGVTARRKRNQGRLKALMDLRQTLAVQKKDMGSPGQWNPQLLRSGKVLVTAENIGVQYGEQVLFKDFSFLLMRGDKLGIVGPNGCGKTSLAKILLNQLKPSMGCIQYSSNMEVIYFDQMQQKLNPEETLMHNIADGAEYIELGDKKIHIASYLKDFLFDASQLQRPVYTLSGGEKQRLVLAKCLTEKGNLMVFDEPSNDLDLETIERLSDLLVQYTGSLILISHDRALIEDVVTRLLVWESPGVFREILVEHWQPHLQTKQPEPSKKNISSKSVLSYAEHKELLKCPDEIAKLEKKIEEIHTEMARQDFYQRDVLEQQKWQQQLEAYEGQLERLFERWEALEQKQKREP